MNNLKNYNLQINLSEPTSLTQEWQRTSNAQKCTNLKTSQERRATIPHETRTCKYVKLVTPP